MRIFQTKWFAKWAKNEGLTDVGLRSAVAEIELGLIDADLGGHVIKKRVAVGGRGKSGGIRTILVFQAHSKTFFLYGFRKNQRANIEAKELQALKKMAAHLLGYDDPALDKAIHSQELVEVQNE